MPDRGWYPDESGIERWWDGNAWTAVRFGLSVEEIIPDRRSAAQFILGTSLWVLGIVGLAGSFVIGSDVLALGVVAVGAPGVIIVDRVARKAERQMRGSRPDWWTLPITERLRAQAAARSVTFSLPTVRLAWRRLRGR